MLFKLVQRGAPSGAGIWRNKSCLFAMSSFVQVCGVDRDKCFSSDSDKLRMACDGLFVGKRLGLIVY